MDNEVNGFYTTADVMKMMKIGNKSCLELFHQKDFPCIKVGRAFLISKNAFWDYVSARRILA